MDTTTMKDRAIRICLSVCILFGLSFTFHYSSGALAKSNEAFSTLLADYESGTLSYHDYLLYQGYLHFEPGRLANLYPEAVSSRQTLHSTPVIMEIMHNWEILTPAEQEEFKNFFARPAPRPANSVITPSGFFKVHYSTTGSNAVPNKNENGNDLPDFVDAVIEAADRSLLTYRNLGYRDPHGDTGLDGPEFDIFIVDVTPRNIYGETFFPPDVYMLIDNDFSSSIYSTKGADGARVTLAHELHHAVQFSYDDNPRDVFFWEATSTYFEDKVYPDINDYLQYLPDFFSHPEHAFNRRDGWHEYGLSIWNQFTEKKFGDVVLRSTWERIGSGQAALDALDDALEARGSSFNAALGEFYAWNYFTGIRADTVRFYHEGNLYPMVNFADSVSLVQDTLITVANSFLSPRYIYFEDMPSARYSMRVISENSISLWENNAVFSDPLSGASLLHFENGATDASLAINHNGPLASLVFIPVSTARTANSQQGSQGLYTAALDIMVIASEEYDNDRIMVNYPNPFIIDEHGETVIPFSLAAENDVEAFFFTASGKLVKKEALGNLRAGYHPADLRWNGTDDGGVKVGSGIYLVRLKLRDKTLIQKIAVIR